MSDKLTVIWEISDGYVGGSRPHRMTISEDDFSGHMTDEELEEILFEMVDEDFRRKASYSITNEDEVLSWMKSKRDELLKEDSE